MFDICPLMIIAIKESGIISDMEEKQARCLRGNCAWFVSYDDEGKEGCAIKFLADSLHSSNIKAPLD